MRMLPLLLFVVGVSMERLQEFAAGFNHPLELNPHELKVPPHAQPGSVCVFCVCL
jgi:hypothetical protein